MSDLFSGGLPTTSPAPTPSAPSGSSLQDLFSAAPAASTGGPLSDLFSAPAAQSSGSPLQDLFSTPSASPGAPQTPAPVQTPTGPSYKPFGGILGGLANAVHTAGHIASTVGKGAVKIGEGLPAVVGEAAKEAVAIPYGAGENIVNDVAGTRYGGVGAGVGEGGILPSQKAWTSTLNKYPVAGGMLRGGQQTAEELAHPSRIAKNYSNNPVQAALNDIGTLATVLPGVGEAIHGAAIGGESTDAALAAAKAARLAGAEETGTAAARIAKAGDIIKGVGEAPSLPLRSARSGLAAAFRSTTVDPELLHAVDTSGETLAQTAADKAAATGSKGVAANTLTNLAGRVPNSFSTEAVQLAPEELAQRSLTDIATRPTPVAGAADVISKVADAAGAGTQAAAQKAAQEASTAAAARDATSAEIAQNADRAAAQAKLKSLSPTLQRLGDIGARMDKSTKMALDVVEGGMSRIRDVVTPEDAAKLGYDTPAEAKIGITQDTTKKLLASPFVEQLNDVDMASLKAAAEDAGTNVNKYIKDLGFTSLGEATSGRFSYPGAYVPTPVANQLARYSAAAEEKGAVMGALQGVNRLGMMGKLAASPVTLLNRIGHGVLGVADNPNILDSAKLAVKGLAGRIGIGEGLADADKADLAQTVEATHGPVNEARLRIEATAPDRVEGLRRSLANMPADFLAKSPILRAARAVDDSVREGIWVAARHAGASPEEADYILGNTAGNFNRSTQALRNTSAVIPFANWHKQSMIILEHMVEAHPAAFAQFTNAASRMAGYNQQQGIYGGNTRVGGVDVNLGFLNPWGSAGTNLQPSELVSPFLKTAMPIGLGVLPNGKPPSGPTGVISGAGLHQAPSALQQAIRSQPQLQALINGSQPRYSTGQPKPKEHGGGALQTWSTLLGVPTVSTKTELATNSAIAKSRVAAQKRAASTMKTYQRNLLANGTG